ncbi:MAG: FKBP-type peptidyl-prolyl cis-trans isomerase [Luminiphilus sp.]|jgi:FKBP-type peptidyl-prolyl cis-trans isomerase|nr:FKBP-type peptidyl-prolyl cis-trans isomerase [Luminiphilus sp.]
MAYQWQKRETLSKIPQHVQRRPLGSITFLQDETMFGMTTRRLATFLMAPVLVGAMSACQEQAKEPEPMTLDTPEKRLSYGIALRMGERMAADGMTMDVDAYAMGMRDAFDGAEPRLSEEEITAEMMAFQEKMQAERDGEQATVAAGNSEAGAAFLAENAQRDGVTVTESGLQYEVVVAGSGASPGVDDQVEVHYRGTLIDGTVFDSSYDRGQTVTFGVTQVIAGWTEALQLMQAGATYKLYIPSDLAYGAGGAGQIIGPNATLIFDVELVAIVAPE